MHRYNFCAFQTQLLQSLVDSSEPLIKPFLLLVQLKVNQSYEFISGRKLKRFKFNQSNFIFMGVFVALKLHADFGYLLLQCENFGVDFFYFLEFPEKVGESTVLVHFLVIREVAVLRLLLAKTLVSQFQVFDLPLGC